jgi:DNA primase catalytic core
MYEKIVESCRFLLKNYPDAQASKSYLDSRLDPESQDKWGFGYFPGIQNISALTSLVGEANLIKLGLLTSRNSWAPGDLKDFFEDQPLVMPFRDAYGKIVALIGRTILDKISHQAKYKNTVFKKGSHLFGLYENKQAILDQGCVYIVEGQFDVIKAVERGFKNIVALSNNNMTSYQFSVISRYSNNLFLLLDNDEAGQKGRKRIISKFGQLANIRNFYIPDDYKDIDEYITKGRISDYAEMSFVVKD